ncbi:N-acetylmuramoyl-L-alanine amidase [Pararhodobacter sp. SW119]|uniref:peptidoglycan recognition protein family protein n=1 Tax=Pararhodobacter sp. SW119 TaxID=2780075 RepID=UPI001ADECEDC|nr:N-acetylmuramoyl-L-alanine amidase [Pararhodobacter sp. SW119]
MSERTRQGLFELRVAIAKALSIETDAGKKQELQDELDTLQEERDRHLTMISQALADELEKPIQRVEQIVRELQNEDLHVALRRAMDKLRIAKVGAASTRLVSQPSQPITTTSVGPLSSSSAVPASWMPNVTMDRVICHWTAGGYRAGGLDKFHYHIMIEGDGTLVRGKFSIADNVRNLIWNPRNYAAHTKGTNTRAIGVSVCSMAGAAEGPPLNLGTAPMLKLQWERMIEVVAQLCRIYDIAVTPTTVLGHGEVEANIGNKQSGKWDPLVLPWDLNASKTQAGTMLRQGVSDLLGN